MSPASFAWGIVLIFVGMVVVMLVAPVGIVMVGGLAAAGVWCVVGWVWMRREAGSGARLTGKEERGEQREDQVFLS